MGKYYIYEHIVSFEETNLVGNVYFANFIKWQGTCREMFIRDNAPTILTQLNEDLSMVTVNVNAEFYEELYAFDLVRIKMYLEEMVQNRVKMVFEYYRVKNDHEELVASGSQQIACVRKVNDVYQACPVPMEFKNALLQYNN